MDADAGQLVFDPLDPGFLQDPYPTYAALREREPLLRSPAGAWVLTRYADVLAALGDTRLGNSPSRYAVLHPRNRSRHVAADVANNIIPFLEPPQHTLPRRLISRTFHARLHASAPRLDRVARELLELHAGAGKLELIADFGTPFAATVLCGLMGLPEDDRDRLIEWSRWFFYLFAPIPSEQILLGLDRALAEFRDYIAGAIDERRREARDDLIGSLLAARDGEESLGEAALIDHCMLLFADGIENVHAAIANAVVALLDHPQQLCRLREDPGLALRAADECLRFDSPAQSIARVAREDLELFGRTIRRDEPLLLVLGSANRDPARFRRPDALDVGRTPNPYLSFGRGRHSCVGAMLVRQEVAAAIGALFEVMPAVARAETRLHWSPRPGHRWLESLPLTTGR